MMDAKALRRIVWRMVFFAAGVSLVFLPFKTGHCEPVRSKAGAAFISVVDSTGRTVKVPARVKRIACLYLFTGHVVTMLGRGQDIIAVSNGLKRVSLLNRICPSIQNASVPKVQGSINIEELLEARPDILFLPGDVAGDPQDMAKLKRFEIPSVIVDFNSIQTQQQAIRIIAKAIGETARAERFIAYYNACIRRVREVTRQIPENRLPRVYYSVNEPLRTTLVHGLTGDWLRLTGCIDVAGARGQRLMEGKNYTSLEQVLLWNPDVILANEPASAETIRHDNKWSTLRPVRDGKVYCMPIGISRWGHPGSMETPLAILWTAKKLHPKLFSNIDMRAETRSFYRTFFNYTLSDQEIERILTARTKRKPKKS
jgi:iron complex transport system substrate-binding protein